MCGVKDACSRKVVSTAMDHTMTADLVQTALHRSAPCEAWLPVMTSSVLTGAVNSCLPRWTSAAGVWDWLSPWGEPACAGTMS